jgi:hypothetical protein
LVCRVARIASRGNETRKVNILQAATLGVANISEGFQAVIRHKVIPLYIVLF